MSTSSPLVALCDVSHQYQTPAGPFTALSHVDLEIERGELIAIVGRSGSGKTTLIHLLTGIDRASSGSVSVGGTVLDRMSESELSAWRGRNVGIVFQFFQLLPTLTIAENVILPMELAGSRGDRRARALDLLDRVGIRDQANKLPATLSGGQQQRAAIARALANDPPLVVADEPTGNLDRNTAADVWSLFRSLQGDGKTVVVVSHDLEIARFASRTISIADGSIAALAPSRKAVSNA